MPFLEATDRLTRGGIPQTGSAVATCRYDFLAVTREPRRQHCIFMSGENCGVQYAHFFISTHVPQPHAFIIAAGENPFTVRRKRTRSHTAAVTTQRLH